MRSRPSWGRRFQPFLAAAVTAVGVLGIMWNHPWVAVLVCGVWLGVSSDFNPRPRKW